MEWELRLSLLYAWQINESIWGRTKPMAKIIAFPKNSCCAHQHSKHSGINRALFAGALPSLVPGTNPAARIQPIWKSRTHGILMSVVVPARGRPGLLNRCLASLMRQSISPLRYEIIVVDTAPSSASRKVVEHYLTRPGNGPCIIYLPVESRESPGTARNHGWHIARGTLIAFTEEDMIPCRDWLSQGLQAFDGVAQAVSGRIIMPAAGLPTAHENFVKKQEQAELASVNCFFLKHVLEELGGFDERFGTAGHEDADLYFRLLQADAVISDAPLAVVEHPLGTASWGASLREQKNLQFDALLYKKHPHLYREKIAPALPLHYHANVAALLLFFIGLAMHNLPLTLLGAFCWGMLITYFCLQRLRDTEKSLANISEVMAASLLLPPLAIFWRLVGALRFRIGFT
jgi:GT2 family glycosyltransferase